MNKKILLLIVLLLFLSGCNTSNTTQEEIIDCQQLCLDNKMAYVDSNIQGFKNEFFSCTCNIKYLRDREKYDIR